METINCIRSTEFVDETIDSTNFLDAGIGEISAVSLTLIWLLEGYYIYVTEAHASSFEPIHMKSLLALLSNLDTSVPQLCYRELVSINLSTKANITEMFRRSIWPIAAVTI